MSVFGILKQADILPLREAGEGQKLPRGYPSFRPFGTVGSDRNRTPVASKIALPIAGAKPIIGHSPAPADEIS
jgi:hypothetical protein